MSAIHVADVTCDVAYTVATGGKTDILEVAGNDANDPEPTYCGAELIIVSSSDLNSNAFHGHGTT